MAIKKVKVKDKQNNTYYPRTIADIVEETDNKNFISLNEKKTISSVSNPNLLINGDFQIWQRGTEFIIPNRRYTADRWQVQSTNGSIAGNGVRKNANGMEGILCTQALRYLMEESDLRRIAGKKVTLSWSLNEKISSRTFVCLSTNPILDLGIGAGHILNWVKLELGEVATSFIPRPYAEELALCKRYYETFYWSYRMPCNKTTTAYEINIPFKVQKRVSPTITINTFSIDGIDKKSTLAVYERAIERVGLFTREAINLEQRIEVLGVADAEIY